MEEEERWGAGGGEGGVGQPKASLSEKERKKLLFPIQQRTTLPSRSTRSIRLLDRGEEDEARRAASPRGVLGWRAAAAALQRRAMGPTHLPGSSASTAGSTTVPLPRQQQQPPAGGVVFGSQWGAAKALDPRADDAWLAESNELGAASDDVCDWEDAKIVDVPMVK